MKKSMKYKLKSETIVPAEIKSDPTAKKKLVLVCI